jgi:hypothetical protein
MDAVGVDGAVPAFTMYRYDVNYAIALRNRDP